MDSQHPQKIELIGDYLAFVWSDGNESMIHASTYERAHQVLNKLGKWISLEGFEVDLMAGISVPLESKISNALVTMQSESSLVMGMQVVFIHGIYFAQSP